MKNSLEFRNGRLRLLQVSDPQDLKYVRRAMVRMLNKAYDDLKPNNSSTKIIVIFLFYLYLQQNHSWIIN